MTQTNAAQNLWDRWRPAGENVAATTADETAQTRILASGQDLYALTRNPHLTRAMLEQLARDHPDVALANPNCPDDIAATAVANVQLWRSITYAFLSAENLDRVSDRLRAEGQWTPGVDDLLAVAPNASEHLQRRASSRVRYWLEQRQGPLLTRFTPPAVLGVILLRHDLSGVEKRRAGLYTAEADHRWDSLIYPGRPGMHVADYDYLHRKVRSGVAWVRLVTNGWRSGTAKQREMLLDRIRHADVRLLAALANSGQLNNSEIEQLRARIGQDGDLFGYNKPIRAVIDPLSLPLADALWRGVVPAEIAAMHEGQLLLLENLLGQWQGTLGQLIDVVYRCEP